jgi:hypothetical protein
MSTYCCFCRDWFEGLHRCERRTVPRPDGAPFVSAHKARNLPNHGTAPNYDSGRRVPPRKTFP